MFFPPRKATEFMAWMVNHSAKGDETHLFPNHPFQAIEAAGTKAEIKAQHRRG